MSYIHNNKAPVVLKKDPIDENGSDWVYFNYGSCLKDSVQDEEHTVWLRAGETITSHEAITEGGVIVTDSTYLGSMTDGDGLVYGEVYAVKFSVAEEIFTTNINGVDTRTVTITHRKSTTTSGAVDLGRTSIDHSIIIPVVSL
jgi:hypothetical protein